MRLTKIYTRQGDAGQTRLATGEKVTKDADVVQCMGHVDSCNSLLGVALCEVASSSDLAKQALQVQHWLFDIGGELALTDYVAIQPAHTLLVEGWIDAMNVDLKPLEEFILPGGSKAAAHMHVFRSEVRRLESRFVSFQKNNETLNPETLTLVNRLSDWAFVAARFCNLENDCPEPYWQPSLSKPN